MTSSKDNELLQVIRASLQANHAEFSDVNTVKVVCRNGEVILSGSFPIRAERALAERLVREATGVTNVKNLIVVGVK